MYGGPHYEMERRSGELKSVIGTAGRASSPLAVVRMSDRMRVEKKYPGSCASTAGNGAAPPL